MRGNRWRAGLGLALLVLLAACAPAGGATPTAPEMPTLAPPTLQPTLTADPAAMATATATAAQAALLETVDLTELASAWSRGEVDAIRSFYAPDAVYLSVDQAAALQRGPVEVRVASDVFAERVREHQGLEFKIVGQPISVLKKLVAFAFRWQDAGGGFDGVALLRYEGGLIWMHTYAIAPERTPNRPDDSQLQPVDLASLAAAWSSGKPEVASPFYVTGAGVFNDEDIAFSLVGKRISAEGLAGGNLASEVRENGGPWGMTTVGQSWRVGNLAFGAWSWKTFKFPVGYGVRLIRFNGDRLDMDIRYAVRPWEVNGGTFRSGY